jgi:hypothetical protein
MCGLNFFEPGICILWHHLLRRTLVRMWKKIPQNIRGRIALLLFTILCSFLFNSTRVRRNKSFIKFLKSGTKEKKYAFSFLVNLQRGFFVMHEIEPFYNWRHLYTAEEDPRSPFFGRTYSEFEYSQVLYNYYIHPQWDEFGSRTLYMKILYADYELQFVIIELIGEWNDAIENDIMTLKRDVTDKLFAEGITKFILITENVLNFHSSDREYYQEWFDEVTDEGGWIVALNMPEPAQYDFRKKSSTIM